MNYTATNKITNGDFSSSSISNWSSNTGLAISRQSETVDSQTNYYLQLKTTQAFTDLDHAVDAYTNLSLTQPSDTAVHKFFVHLLSSSGFDRAISVHWTITYPSSAPIPQYDASLESYDGKHFYTILDMKGDNYTVTLTKIAVGLVQGESYSENQIARVDDVIVIDLTAMFGAGNEPPAEWCAKRYSISGSTVTIPQYVPSVQNLRYENVGPHSATVLWDALTGADSYRLNRNRKPIISDVSLQTNSYSENDLYMGTVYQYSVEAEIDGVYSEPSTVVLKTEAIPKPESSGEYSYKLLRILQRHFRCEKITERKGLLSLAGWLLNDPNVLITEEAYNNFISLFNQELEYFAKKNLSRLDDIANDPNYGTIETIFKNAFASIGITITRSGDTYIFEVPSGDQRQMYGAAYSDDNMHSTIYLNSRIGSIEDYWIDIRNVYLLTNEPVENLEDMETSFCGPSATWEYDELNGALLIDGEGEMYSWYWSEPGIPTKDVTTAVVGAGINSMPDYSFSGSLAQLGTNNLPLDVLVCLQAEDAPVTLGQYWLGTRKSSKEMTIYADNTAIRSFNYAVLNIKPTFKHLSEWEGF